MIVEDVRAVFFDQMLELDQREHPVVVALVLVDDAVEVFVEAAFFVNFDALFGACRELAHVARFVEDAREERNCHIVLARLILAKKQKNNKNNAKKKKIKINFQLFQ